MHPGCKTTYLSLLLHAGNTAHISSAALLLGVVKKIFIGLLNLLKVNLHSSKCTLIGKYNIATALFSFKQLLINLPSPSPLLYLSVLVDLYEKQEKPDNPLEYPSVYRWYRLLDFCCTQKDFHPNCRQFVWFTGPVLVAVSLISSSQIRQGQSWHIKPLSRKLLPSAAGSDWPAAEVR